MHTNPAKVIAISLAVLAGTGCTTVERAPCEGDVCDAELEGTARSSRDPDSGQRGGARTEAGEASPTDGPVDDLDLLFVIDNSRSMAEAQARLREQLPRLLLALASGNKDAGKDEPEGAEGHSFRPFTSIQLGITSADMGAAGNAILSCDKPDDGVLLDSTEIASAGFESLDADSSSLSWPPEPTCEGVKLSRYLTFEPPSNPGHLLEAVQDAAHALGCAALLGTGGCGFEQPLEAMLKAVSPSDREDFLSYPGFSSYLNDEQVVFEGTERFGHGGPDGKNAGFVRDNALLAVIVLSNEDDCSITPAANELFATAGMGAFTDEPVNLRCGLHRLDEKLVHPPERYVEGLRSLKPGRREAVFFAAIVGVQPELEQLNIDQLREETTFSFDGYPTDPLTHPNAICKSPGGSEAFPAERLVLVAQGFAPMGLVRSICRDDFGPAIDAIIDNIATWR